ncbi:MAG: hypothetical protein BJG00_008375 [Limnothrix sp. CACIAM 69d]|nr:MAG: hypothetical protein BJG00_008375 [Limnothrix sp. CACIAM 69d]
MTTRVRKIDRFSLTSKKDDRPLIPVLRDLWILDPCPKTLFRHFLRHQGVSLMFWGGNVGPGTLDRYGDESNSGRVILGKIWR